jgi:hypothetical protein
MDEVAGFAPPTAQPPSKKPMLTILKQARAHGVGMVLATQNPVDVDYKAMANAGTWMIGRLQTERDKARVLEGMRSAAGNVHITLLDTAIGALGQREFLLHTSRGGPPRRFTSRWAMSFLRGPLTRIEIERLMHDDPERVAAAAPSAPVATAARAEATKITADQVSVAPAVSPDVRVRYLDPAAPWAEEVGAVPGGTRLEAALAARVHLRYDDTAAGVAHTETYECVFFPLTDPVRPEAARAVDYDERDLTTESPTSACYALPAAPIDRAPFFRSFEKQLREHLHRTRAVEVFVNRDLKLYSRVGESREDFVARCHSTAAALADAEAAKLRHRVQAKLERVQEQQRTAEDRVRELTVDSRQRLQQEIVAGAGQLLSVFMGGRGGVRSLAGAASRRGATRRTRERLDTATGRAEDLADQLRQIEEELADDLAALNDKWNSRAELIDTKAIPLEQSDVTIAEVVLLWVPVAP